MVLVMLVPGVLGRWATRRWRTLSRMKGSTYLYTRRRKVRNSEKDVLRSIKEEEVTSVWLALGRGVAIREGGARCV